MRRSLIFLVGKFFLVILVWCALFNLVDNSVLATDYYVDNVNGLNTNNGASAGTELGKLSPSLPQLPVREILSMLLITDLFTHTVKDLLLHDQEQISTALFVLLVLMVHQFYWGLLIIVVALHGHGI